MMAVLRKYMVVHRDPATSWEKVEENWRTLANIEMATWVRTYYNKREAVRYCIWMAEDKGRLNRIFSELQIPVESIVEVEETVPDLWGKKWEEHLKEEKKADTLGF